MSFLLILVGILKKGRNQKNMGNFGGPMPQRKDHTQQHRSTPRRGMLLRRGVATVHSMEIFVFRFVLFFRCFKDLSIGLMRTL